MYWLVCTRGVREGGGWGREYRSSLLNFSVILTSSLCPVLGFLKRPGMILICIDALLLEVTPAQKISQEKLEVSNCRLTFSSYYI